MWPLCGMLALGIVLRAFAGPPPCRLGEVLQTSFRAEPFYPVRVTKGVSDPRAALWADYILCNTAVPNGGVP